MAKWGEGDPRWIVEERPDATNVNNWHWTDKNATPWSKDRLKELFKNYEIKSDANDCKVTEVSKIEGEATANNRKGKLIFFYEWNIELKWKGWLSDIETGHEGKIVIPNFSEENKLDEVEVTISINESNDDSEKLKSFMYNEGRGKIREQLGVYLQQLRDEFSQGLILPRKDGVVKVNDNLNSKTDGVTNITSGFNKKIDMEPVVSTEKLVGCPIDVKTLKFTENFQCRAVELYDCLTKPELVTAFTRGEAKVDATKGGEFALFGGNISGKFIDLVPNEKIVQTWRYKQWPDGHYSEVTIKFTEKSDHTRVSVKQTGVPANEQDVTLKNWQQYYWNSIKQAFGFGSFLY